MKKPYKCPSQIWRKFSKEQKKWYKDFYNIFLFELNLLSEISNATAAHNLACLVVWSKDPMLIKGKNSK